MDIVAHVHLGLPKSASTSIQAIYSEIGESDVLFLGKHLKDRPEKEQFFDSWLANLVRNDLLLLPDQRFDQKYQRGCLLHRVRQESFSTLVLSDEVLSTVGFHTLFVQCVSFDEVVRRCDRILDGCHVQYHLVLRDMERFMESYFNHLKVSHHLRYSRTTLQHYLTEKKPTFASVVDGSLPQSILGSRLTTYQFDEVVGSGMPLFHRSEVVPLPRHNSRRDRELALPQSRIYKWKHLSKNWWHLSSYRS